MSAANAIVLRVSVSTEKGVPKTNVEELRLIPDWGAQGDAHAGSWHRQVSLLAMESIEKMRAKGLEVRPGDFAENITTQGLDLLALPVGTRLRVGPEALLEVTQIGKHCHTGCVIFQQVGQCIMPKEGIFAKVLVGGLVKPGDPIRIVRETQR
ncbi:MAG: MOSC domain-containing protein [Thermodesulfobacteriota bacterium]